MPDDYAAGLTRSVVSGRVAYYDQNFRKVIAPRYDWNWHFHKGRALVCADCTQILRTKTDNRQCPAASGVISTGKGKKSFR
jgi:hypothetical protein